MKNNNLSIIIIAVIVAAGIYGAITFSTANKNLKTTVAELELNLASSTGALLIAQNDNKNLAEALESEQARNRDFEDQLEELEDTVGILDKLSRTDPELLQKYSKVYFLNENYIPEKLSDIDTKYLAQGKKDIQIETRVKDDLRDMFEAAEDDKVNLRVISAYRSFWDQQSLKSSYTVSYGSGANAFSADQGYSEHQLGTAIDLTTAELGLNYTSIEATEAYEWLTKNAYKYGFILSYPKGNAYYVFEPWHWRFVGKRLARDLNSDKDSFYDLEQRELDEYLVNFFD